MNFHDKSFLRDHCRSIMAFYDKRIVDKSGGYFQNFLDDGQVFAPNVRHLVSSTRIVVNYAVASDMLARPDYKAIAKHGLDYIEQVHWQSDSECYAWTLDNHLPIDMTQQAYGYAFVLLAYANCIKHRIIDTKEQLYRVFELLEVRFWQKEHGLYADEITVDGALSNYRGQNANMHLCEALIAAYEATEDNVFLERALLVAENITLRQANLSDGLVWEHYTQDFEIDWQYNKDDPKNLYRPWGFQPGHQTEWSKLLLILNRYQPKQWLVDKAAQLFEYAYQTAWDQQCGGLVYGFDVDGVWCDDDKYFWVQAESFAAAALLYQQTGQAKFLDSYQALWQYSWQHLIDHKHGAWFRVVTRDNRAYSNEKSSAGAKCDYHTLGACFEVLRAL